MEIWGKQESLQRPILICLGRLLSYSHFTYLRKIYFFHLHSLSDKAAIAASTVTSNWANGNTYIQYQCLNITINLSKKFVNLSCDFGPGSEMLLKTGVFPLTPPHHTFLPARGGENVNKGGEVLLFFPRARCANFEPCIGENFWRTACAAPFTGEAARG